jgi:HlyD family secretion protein
VTRAKLDDAKESLEALMGEPDASQLALKQAESDAARENLRELETGDPLVIGLRQSALAAAKAALETAQARLEGAVLKAPWKGEINAVNVSAGQAVTQATAAIEIVDPSTVQLEGSLDEIDVLFVQEGAQAQVTLDALAGAVVQGTVAEIASQGVSQQGVVTFPITIDVTAPQGVSLREGLSATATIVLNQESNVLLIPVQSVSGSFDEPVVRVATGKTVRQQSVKLGSSDGYWIVVVDGLVEGDRVVMAAPQTATTQAGGALLRGLGGAGIGIPIGVGGGPTFRQEFQRPGQGTGGQGAGARGQGTQGNQRTGGNR